MSIYKEIEAIEKGEAWDESDEVVELDTSKLSSVGVHARIQARAVARQVMKQRVEYDELVWLLTVKYVEDPDTFRKYLPGVADALDCIRGNHPPRPVTVLSEQERAFHEEGLKKALKGKEDGVMSSERAVKALEHFAPLAQDVRWAALPYYDARVALLKSAIGKSPCSFEKKETVTINGKEPDSKVVNSVPLLRGINLELDEDWRLLSISVSPHVFRERRKIMGLFGMSHELKIDVSQRVDDYLADIDPYGRD